MIRSVKKKQRRNKSVKRNRSRKKSVKKKYDGMKRKLESKSFGVKKKKEDKSVEEKLPELPSNVVTQPSLPFVSPPENAWEKVFGQRMFPFTFEYK